MGKFAVLLICLSGYCLAGPVGPKRNMPIAQQRQEEANAPETEAAGNVDPNEMAIMSSLSLPSNATSIRADIIDGFSCQNKTYGYYADVDNDCQIFHVCLPVTYADGKENTFRWSFICPEDTIFSQDSFTCMRPDDMRISCDESYQYYELNRNFGMMESAVDGENSNEAANSGNSEAISEAEIKHETIKPVIQEEEETIMEQSKPVTVLKPSRRKPSVSYNIPKKPSISYPLRKVPLAQVLPEMTESPTDQISKDVNESVKPVDDLETKPTVQKFSRRPAPVVSNSDKDKAQNHKAQSVIPIRNDLFNQMRKRPILFNKKPAQQPEEERKKDESKIGTKEEVHQNFSPLASGMSISNTETQVADTEIDASESNQVFVKPEESKEDTQNIESANNAVQEPVQILKAFEEIPAVISEVVETSNGKQERETLATLNEESKVADEPQITEAVQSSEDIQAEEETHNTKESEPSQENEVPTDKTSEDAETQTDVETKSPEEIESTNVVKAGPETLTADETPETQQSLEISDEEIQNVNQPKKYDEKSEEVEKLQDAKQAQNTEEAQVFEEVQMSNEQKFVEETKMIENSPTLHSDEETPAVEHVKTAEEIQAAEEEIPEVHQNLRTSAEEVQNSDKSVVDDEISMAVPAVEVMLPEQTKTLEEAQNVRDEPIEEKVPQVYQSNEVSAVQLQEPEKANLFDELLKVEEPQAVVHKVEESEKIEPQPDSKSVEETAELEQIPAPKDSDLVESENIAEGVASAQTIEQMESEKSSDAPELMPATEEMSQPNTMVQNMFENMDMNKKGGLKPVDPVMAHEAEQLIVDFINTLRKNKFTNETPDMEKVQSGENISEMQDSKEVASDEKTQEVAVKFEDQYDKDEIKENVSEIQTQTMEGNKADKESKEEESSSELNSAKSLEVQSTENMEESQRSENVPAGVMNLPQEMYQIPVQIITSPIEELPMVGEQSQESEIKSAKTTANNAAKIENEPPAIPISSHHPLSIDDIVEIVKERLDHMPKNEIAAPMQLEQVIEEAKEDKAVEEKIEKQTSSQDNDQEQADHSEENIVMPIYQRTVKPLQSEDLENALDEKKTEVADSPSDMKEKTNRSYRSRSVLSPKLDARKRRFLFKTDSS